MVKHFLLQRISKIKDRDNFFYRFSIIKQFWKTDFSWNRLATEFISMKLWQIVVFLMLFQWLMLVFMEIII